MKHNMITALDVGSSNIRCIMASVNANGKLDVLGFSSVPSKGIEKGIVKDIQALSDCIKQAVTQVEDYTKKKAENIFTNITGEHIKSHVGDGRISIPTTGPNEPGEIDQEHVDQVINDAKKGAKLTKGFERSEILHGIPQGFVIDGQDDIHNPLRMNGFHLITKVYTIFTDVTPLRNLSKCIQIAGYNVAPENYVLNHIAIGNAVLSDDERRLGTILIDIGGGTCDISLYHRDVLEKVLVVPMAGAAITEDLAIGLKTSITNAEIIKTRFGIALASSADPKEELEVAGISGRDSQQKTQHLVSHVIQHRVEELLSLCYNKLKNCYTPELVTAGIVLTGGTANLKQITPVVKTSFNMPVKIAKPNQNGLSQFRDELDDPAFATAIGLLYHGAAQDKTTRKPLLRLSGDRASHLLDTIKNFIKAFTSS